ncbi:MAG: MaoC family dehydratase [Pseudomonadota bacterium]
MSDDLHGYYIEDLSPGMKASYARTVTDADIVIFAGVTGDDNPVHLNREFAEATMFKSRIAHGMLSAGYISTVVGTRLPGAGAIYVGQTLKFKAPVRVGDTVVTEATVKEVIAAKRRVIVETICRVGDTVVVEGEATLMVDSKG